MLCRRKRMTKLSAYAPLWGKREPGSIHKNTYTWMLEDRTVRSQTECTTNLDCMLLLLAPRVIKYHQPNQITDNVCTPDDPRVDKAEAEDV